MIKDPSRRSYFPLTRGDLERLLALARADRDAFFQRHPEWAALYQNRVICTALCQGAALHYVGGQVGINDFDVYTFYARHPDRPWYAKRIKAVDFGDPRFGTSQEAPATFVGRRVDLLGRHLDVPVGADPVIAVRDYLQAGASETARFLREKAVVLLEPHAMLGEVVWPVPA